MNDLLLKHHELLTVEDWQDIANRIDKAMEDNHMIIWAGLEGIGQDDDTEQTSPDPAPESTADNAGRARDPELPMMILGVLGMNLANFAGHQIEKIRETKDAEWIPPALDVEGRPEGDAPVGIENAPESE